MQMSYCTALAWGCSGAEHFTHSGEVRVIKKQIITKLNGVGSQDPVSAWRCQCQEVSQGALTPRLGQLKQLHTHLLR